MTTIQELEQNISSIKEELSKLEEKLKTLKSGVGRQMPENGDIYYFIEANGTVYEDKWTNDSFDQQRFYLYNYFKTNEEAQREIDRRLIKAKLNEIANRLNGGQVIKWDSAIQRKYYLELDSEEPSLHLNFSIIDKIEGVTYCLSQDFLEVAVDEIGEQELFDYMKNN